VDRRAETAWLSLDTFLSHEKPSFRTLSAVPCCFPAISCFKVPGRLTLSCRFLVPQSVAATRTQATSRQYQRHLLWLSETKPGKLEQDEPLLLLPALADSPACPSFLHPSSAEFPFHSQRSFRSSGAHPLRPFCPQNAGTSRHAPDAMHSYGRDGLLCMQPSACAGQPC